MSDVAIRVERLSKRYCIPRSDTRASYRTLRESLAQAVAAPLRRLRRPASVPAYDTVWALDDVSFEVRRGEVLGIVGRNGAGKSTLLKVLSRITEPTRGRAEVWGRVGALLEVGTGFHLELTGRENIFLNGAILGMRRVEIQRRFDEIVAFSEIERFLDTPVKRYSSGMFMRLAFAVAAHLEAEILLVDEVLAVGDAAFQKKCLSKMGDVAHAGRTVLFVSHNMTAIRSLCARAALIEGGRLASDGGIDEVIALYLGRSTESPSEPRLSQETGVLACEVLAADRSGHAAKERFADRILIFRFTVRGPRDARSRLALGGRLTDAQGNTIGTVYSDYCGVHYDSEPGQVFQVEVTNQGLRLAPGGYVFWPEMWRGKEQLRSSFDKVAFQVLPADVFGSGYGGFEGNGPILWEACWSKASTPGAAG